MHADPASVIPDGGPIFAGSQAAEQLGLLESEFDAGSYLWKTGGRIDISFVFAKSPGRGSFSKLLRSLWDKGSTVCVPTPLGHMREILIHKGFRQTFEWDKDFNEDIEVWVKEP